MDQTVPGALGREQNSGIAVQQKNADVIMLSNDARGCGQILAVLFQVLEDHLSRILHLPALKSTVKVIEKDDLEHPQQQKNEGHKQREIDDDAAADSRRFPEC